MNRRFMLSLSLAGIVCLSPLHRAPAQSITVASKQDAETAILAEMAAILIRENGQPVRLTHSLGGTPVVWKALSRGDVDIYPEYTGTIAQQILHDPSLDSVEQLRASLASQGIGLTRPLGFANNYALGMTSARAKELNIRTISDLVSHANLRMGFSSEFLGRNDGWPGLKRHYQLPQKDVRGLDHQLAYIGLANGNIDVTDLYTTDAEIHTRSLAALIDDRNFFPRYEAVFAYRLELHDRAPRAIAALTRLEGRITAETIIRLNEQAKSQIDPARVADEFLQGAFGTTKPSDGLSTGETWLDRLRIRTAEHLALVGGAVVVSIIVGIPLGIVAARRPRLGAGLLGITGLVQTIPALALLALMVPLPFIGGIGAKPALIALSLYGLLPVVRNTLTGLRDVPANLREAAAGLGLPSSAILWRVELPMASRAILAGIKTSAVITVGTATLGGLIGAGGYGQEIIRGVNLNDTSRILQGAIPAAILALLVEIGFTLIERVLVPRGLRLKPVD
jgi:osmoprotectant transport system permease protein